jgi:hypothetical protein
VSCVVPIGLEILLTAEPELEVAILVPFADDDAAVAASVLRC